MLHEALVVTDSIAGPFSHAGGCGMQEGVFDSILHLKRGDQYTQ